MCYCQGRVTNKCGVHNEKHCVAEDPIILVMLSSARDFKWGRLWTRFLQEIRTRLFVTPYKIGADNRAQQEKDVQCSQKEKFFGSWCGAPHIVYLLVLDGR